MNFLNRSEATHVAKRRAKLMSIKKTIESNIKFEDVGLMKLSDFSDLKRRYKIDSLWIVENKDIRQFGEMNYDEEIKEYGKLKKKYEDLQFIKFQRGDDKYYIIENGQTLYAFSTTLDMSSNEIFILLKELNRVDLSGGKSIKKVSKNGG